MQGEIKKNVCQKRGVRIAVQFIWR